MSQRERERTRERKSVCETVEQRLHCLREREREREREETERECVCENRERVCERVSE